MMRIFYTCVLCLSLCLLTFTAAKADNIDNLLRQYDALPTTDLKMDVELGNLLALSASLAPEALPESLENIATPIRVLIDVRSNHSDGAHDFKTLIELAKKRHIDVLTFTEHDRYSIRFGIDPMPHILGYSMEHPSLYATGLTQFFTDLTQAQQQYPEMGLYAGTESTAGYYWQGIPFQNLSLHNAERHFITLGVEQEAQIQALSSYSLRHAYGNTELSLIFWFVLVFMLIFYLLRKRKRGVALLLAGSFIAFITTWLMKPVVDADADFIQSAQEQGLWTIWTHPGTLSGVRPGPFGVKLDTPPYNQRVFTSPTADAFAAVYGDTDQNTMAGGMWDQWMLDYMHGYVAKPLWAVAAGDYHEEGQSAEYLGNFPMDVWAKSKRLEDVMAALRQGKMVAWHMLKDQDIAMKALYLSYVDAAGNTQNVQAGDEAVVPEAVRLVVALRSLKPDAEVLSLHGQWIVDGKVAAKVMISTDEEAAVFAHDLQLSQGLHVVRLKIPGQQGIRLESNPFLLRVR
ncbi:MAG: hypothetical protein Q9M19_09435 [Mariprofundaceae bacterium]|nr:hypothetical protein [Mariprofundaceae bacterium]